MAFAVVATGCTGAVVFADRHQASPTTSILRLATERGIKDASTSESTVFEIPFEVRTRGDSIRLPGCALRAFRIPTNSGSDFRRDSIREDDTLQLEMVSMSELIVPPNRTLIATLRLTDPNPPPDRRDRREDDPEIERLGLRVEETPSVISPSYTAPCTDIRSTEGPVQHYGLNRVTVEPGGLGVMAGAGILIAILVLAAR